MHTLSGYLHMHGSNAPDLCTYMEENSARQSVRIYPFHSHLIIMCTHIMLLIYTTESRRPSTKAGQEERTCLIRCPYYKNPFNSMIQSDPATHAAYL